MPTPDTGREIAEDLGSRVSHAPDPERSGPRSLRQANTVLLTGATGFLGGYLLEELTRRSPCKVFPLVRAPNAQMAEFRLRQKLQEWQHAAAMAALGDRIRTVCGNFEYLGLGLDDRFDTLAAEADFVVHCGAKVNFVQDYASLRRANVEAVSNMLDFARYGANKYFLHISTFSILYARDFFDTFTATEVDLPGPDPIHIGYAESKLAAEKLVRRAAAEGVATMIARPAFMTGDSHSGRGLSNYTISVLLQMILALQAVPMSPTRLVVYPVDRTAAEIVSLALDGAMVGRTAHLLPRKKPAVSALYSVLRALGEPVSAVATNDWLAMAQKRFASDYRFERLLPFLRMFLLDGATTYGRIDFDATATHSALDALGITPFESDLDYLRAVVGWQRRQLAQC